MDTLDKILIAITFMSGVIFLAISWIKVRELFTERAKAELINFTISSYKKIKVNPGQCRMNFRCQINAMNDAINAKDPTLAACIYIDDGHPIVHFVNISKDGSYIDNTLGQWSQNFSYYLIRVVNKEEFKDINTILGIMQEEFQKNISFLNRILSGGFGT